MKLFSVLVAMLFTLSTHAQCESAAFTQGNGSVNISGDLSQLSNFSKFIRFKITTPIANPTTILMLYHSPNGALYYDVSSNQLRFNILNRQGCNCCGQGCTPVTTYSFATGLSVDQWHTIALSVTSSNVLTVYLNGSPIPLSSPTFDGCCSGNYNYTSLGNVSGFNLGFNGYIEEAAMWNTALSGAQLQSLHACNSVAAQSPLAWWRYAPSTGTMPDLTGNGYNGALAGSASSAAETSVCCVEGCTDTTACNFNASATVDDGSCTYPGCTDAAACNYDPSAACDDGSCTTEIDCNGNCGGSFILDDCGNCYDPALAVVEAQTIFEYTGGPQSFVVPDGVTSIVLDVYGAQGSDAAYGGRGGRASGSLAVTPGQELLIYVGGNGWSGGWNGGGNLASGNERRGGGGSDVRINGNALANRIIVAGGGGVQGNATTSGCGSTDIPVFGGSGGAEIGGAGGAGGTATGGTGGTQSGGGAPGSGNIGSGTPGTLGQGGNGFSNDAFGGGGGGYFGGGGGGTSGGCNRGAGGGGSNYLGGVTLIASEAGVNEGHGRIIISYQLVNVPDCNPGCTDQLASNFDSEANFDDGSCTYPGCTDPEASNYDAQANEDDGSCTYPGCTDPMASNYDAQANEDDGSCTYPGCTDPAASNYDAQANEDDGSCTYPGCTDPLASNYDAQANEDDGSCTYPGCTDPLASNYDAQANEDDGSCIYPGCTNPAATNYDAQANEDDGSCIIPGCRVPFACNYNPQATIDDGSCENVSCAGCTYPDATNYDATATIDNGSCAYPTLVEGCTYLDASNYNPLAEIDNGSCEFTLPLCPADLNADGLVNASDLSAFLTAFGTTCSE